MSPSPARVLIACLACLALTLACGDEPAGSPGGPSISGSTYDNPDLSFSIAAPDNWVLHKDTVVEGERLLLYGIGPGDTDSNLVLSLTRNEAFETASSDPFVAIRFVYSGLSLIFADLDTVGSDTVMVDGAPCAALTYDATISGDYNRCHLVYVVHRGAHLILNFSSLQTLFESHRPALDSILSGTDLY